MKISKKDLRRILAEELDLDKLYEPKEDAYAGGENLHLDIDFENKLDSDQDDSWVPGKRLPGKYFEE